MADKKDLLCLLMQKNPQKASELAEQLDVTTRTIYRWVDKLIEEGVPVNSTTGRSGGISLDEEYKPSQEMLTNFSSFMNSSVLSKEYTVQNWIEIDFTQKQIEAEVDKKYDICKEAILSKHVMNFTYHLPENKALVCTTEPIRFFLHENEWHILAWVREVDKFKIFKLVNMTDLQICPEKHDRKADFTIKSLLRK